ncbi:CocE/NonD family hydrolase [Dehalococcoidia bacterium]|nr:CocE/NonD family hydrolase [Dehalococcoidia bacterium]
MQLSQPEYDIIVMEDVMVPTRDGIGLATDIYRPAKEGQLIPEAMPVILERTPYNKRAQDRVERTCRYFTRRGYIFAIQDCRGCFRSEGEMDFFWQEGPDGYDTVEWLAGQPWCNGKIGTTGTSYAGWTQNALAVQNPPHLSCMWVNEGASNGYTSTLRQGGALELRFLTWLYWHAAINSNATLKKNPAVAKALNSVDTRDLLMNMPVKKGQTPLRLAPSYERRAMDILTQGDYNDLWKDPSINFQLYWDQFADVPTVFSSAWYDSYTRANLENYVGLSQRKNGPYRLLMGPWTHGDLTIGYTFAGDIDLGAEAPIDYRQSCLRWFDQWLKGIDTFVNEDAPVRIFVMGGGDGRKNIDGRMNHGGSWRDEMEWPLQRAKATSYYLYADGYLRLELPGNHEASTTYLFDPDNPVPTIGGNNSSLATLRPIPDYITDPTLLPQVARVEQIVVSGGCDQRERSGVFGAKPPYNMPLSARRDVLVFQTQPLDDDTEITGPIEVRLWVGCDVPDTDFTAKLIDVYPLNQDYPNGFALNISDGIIRMRYRDSWEKPELMKPDEVYTATIVLYPTSNLFAKGHCIRLDISSSNFPRFDVNPNTGEPLGRNTRVQVATNTVYHNTIYPSHIVLPLIKSE